jgi:hypothetical protein
MLKSSHDLYELILYFDWQVEYKYNNNNYNKIKKKNKILRAMSYNLMIKDLEVGPCDLQILSFKENINFNILV